MACPPSIPAMIIDCPAIHYLDFILDPYAIELALYNEGKINCAEFQARVDAMLVMYEGACGGSES